jgi:hypothetical protein
MNRKIVLEQQLLPFFFRHQIYIKMVHFQTKQYSVHKASDKYYNRFAKNMDRFVEVMQGEVGQVDNNNMVLQEFNFDEYKYPNNIIDKMNLFVETLKKFDGVLGDSNGLLNIRDDMIADAQQFVYLLRFK